MDSKETYTLKENFIKEIEHLIISGEFEIGQKLPSERELSQDYGVSRAVINAGIVEMSRKGFLEVRPRVGTFVSDYRRNGNIETLVSIMNYNGGSLPCNDIKSLLEFRCVVDSMLINLMHRTIEDSSLDVLDKLVENIKSSKSPAEAAEYNFRFYHELALMSGNTIVPLIYSSFKISATHLFERYAKKHGVVLLYENSRTLLDFLKAGDIENAILWKQSSSNSALFGDKQIYDE